VNELSDSMNVQSSQEKKVGSQLEYEFDGKYSSREKERFKSAQENDFQQICGYLETDRQSVGIVKFAVFATKEGKQKADPYHSISRASARGNTVYRVWKPYGDPHFPHETTHVVSKHWDDLYDWEVELDTADGSKITKIHKMISTSFMQEGLAIAVDDISFGRMLTEEGEDRWIDDWCREYIDQIPIISECINFYDFCDFDNKIVVPFAASFSKYLLNRFGIDTYKSMYVQIKETLTPEKNVKIIEKVYGTTEKELMKAWKRSILA